MVSPALRNKTIMLIKGEAAYGTDPTPTPAANAINIYDQMIRNDSQTRQRLVYQPSFSKPKYSVSSTLVSTTFKVELFPRSGIKDNNGSGATDPTTVDGLITLFRALGFTPTWTAETGGLDNGCVLLKPTSSWPDATNTLAGSCTCYVYYGGANDGTKDSVLFKMLGCFGNASIVFESGEFPYLDVELFGLYDSITDSTYPSATVAFDAYAPAICASDSFTLGAYTTGLVPSFSINLNNSVTTRRSITADYGGVYGFRIADRNISGLLQTEMMTEATKAFWGNSMQASSFESEAWTLEHNDVTGKGVKVYMPVVQYQVQPSEREGILMYDVSFEAKQSADAGDDELQITLGTLP